VRTTLPSDVLIVFHGLSAESRLALYRCLDVLVLLILGPTRRFQTVRAKATSPIRDRRGCHRLDESIPSGQIPSSLEASESTAIRADVKISALLVPTIGPFDLTFGLCRR